MRIIYCMRWPRLLSLSFLSIALVFVIAACGKGSDVGSTGSGSAATTVTPTATTASNGTTHGCPSNIVMATEQSKANVTVIPPNVDTGKAFTAHTGDVVEVRVPFGSRWTGPTNSQGNLQLQQPYGYALTSDQVCVWRFVAHSAGTTVLRFGRSAICKGGQMCPMYIREVSVAITVQ